MNCIDCGSELVLGLMIALPCEECRDRRTRTVESKITILGTLDHIDEMFLDRDEQFYCSLPGSRVHAVKTAGVEGVDYTIEDSTRYPGYLLVTAITDNLRIWTEL